MPSSLSHAMVAVALGSALAPRALVRPFLFIGTMCAVIPDVDAIGRPFGAGDIQILGGHRGFTHSLAFAALLGVIVSCCTFGRRRWDHHRLRLAWFVMLATAAHGMLDTLTSIGARSSPVQFFSPFSTQGFTSPWHPIRGPLSELWLCLLPLIAVTLMVWNRRGLRTAAVE